jgi:hypothetical protein
LFEFHVYHVIRMTYGRGNFVVDVTIYCPAWRKGHIFSSGSIIIAIS